MVGDLLPPANDMDSFTSYTVLKYQHSVFKFDFAHRDLLSSNNRQLGNDSDKFY